MTIATTPKPAGEARDPARDRPPEKLASLAISRIRPGSNVRSDLGDVTELAESIKQYGILQPLRVQAQSDSVNFDLLYGHRRLAAAKLAGLSHVPAIVDTSEQATVDRTVKQLIENLQREDLNPLDTAKAYRAILDQGLSQRELAALLGIAQPTVAGALRLLKLPDAIQAKVAGGELSASHAKAIASLPDRERDEVARRAVEHKLSAHQLEEEVRRATDRVTIADRRRDEERQLADKAEESLTKKHADKAKAKLFSYDSGLAAELKKRGWTLTERASYYGAPKGCDCDSWTVSRTYMGNLGVSVERSCRSKAHQEAAQKAADEIAEKRAAEIEKQEAKEVEARAAALAPIVEQLAADPELRARLALIALLDNFGLDEVDAFWKSQGCTPWSTNSWGLVRKLTPADVESWTVKLLAGIAVNEELELAPKPAKGKKAK